MNRWLLGGVVLVACVLPLGVALATHPGTSRTYEIDGFTPDGKYVFFTKRVELPGYEERWSAVFDAATTKLKVSRPVLRDCGDTCEDDAVAIDERAGNRTRSKLYAAYGTPATSSKLVMKHKVSSAAARSSANKAGHVQVFTAPGVEVRAVTKLNGRLADPMEQADASAAFELELTVTAKDTSWMVTRRLYADPVEDHSNGNIMLWPELYVQEVAVAPDRRTVALVFARKPYVLRPARAKPVTNKRKRS